MTESEERGGSLSPEEAYRRARFAVDMENRTDDEVLELASLAIGHVDLAVVLAASVLRRRGEIDRARELLEAHVDVNDRVPFRLGILLQFDVGDLEGAKTAYRAAFERGDASGAYNLAYLVAEEQDGQAEAVEWLRRAGEAGSSLARADLASRGMAEWEEESEDGPYRWVEECYPADLVPWIVASPDPDPAFEPHFLVSDDRPFPTAGQLARAALSDLQIQLLVTKNELDLFSLSAAIPDLRNLRIADGARVTGLSALLDAGSLVDLNLQIKGDEPVDLSTLPALRHASVTGVNFLSVCRHPQLEWLGLDLPRASLLPTIEAPIRTLSMTAKHAGAVLERVAHPHLLESLTLFKARDLDLDVLRRFPNLTKIEMLWCNGIVSTAVLADLPKLRELEMYRCRNLDDAAVVGTVQSRLRGESDQELVIGPFILSEYGEEEDGRFDLSTSSAGWEGIAEPFADRILASSGYQMEKLVVSIAKLEGLWSRGIERDSEAEAIHLIFRGREAAVAVAEAAWAAFCDEDRLDAALQAARMRGKR
ncbi:hypothetical protein [Labedella gwakjiensis]|uniref:Tetratricopeptide repeat protein n=2 Tax=Labedella gwakjiensis TaxID=390269 RepID=A0ABY0C9E7_9MICO|nr:hypothetical protein [Labedella gwakjiensis]RUQ86651.1 hypothetical protein ELQ93_06665 [Labedella gwakjiensis]